MGLNSRKYGDSPEMLRYLKNALLNGNVLKRKPDLMRIGHHKQTTEECLRLMTHLHCKVRRLFDRCGTVDHGMKENISNADVADLKSFLCSQFALMTNR